MSYQLQSTERNLNAVVSLGSSLTTDGIYNNYYQTTQINDPFSSFTTPYLQGFVTKVFRAFFQLEEPTPRQLNTLMNFLFQLHETEKACNSDFNCKIDVVHSVEDEVCFYRKSDKSVTMAAIDNDGDIFFSYMGYEKGSWSNRFYYKEVKDEIEKIVYYFLATSPVFNV